MAQRDSVRVFCQALVRSRTWFPLYRNEVILDGGTSRPTRYVREVLSVSTFCSYASLSETGEACDDTCQRAPSHLKGCRTGNSRRSLVEFKPCLYLQHRWFVDPELLFAFNLSKMGDKWLASGSNNISVLRQRKNRTGEVTAIEIRAAYLREFLLNRGLVIWIAAKNQRSVLLENPCVEDISELSKGDCANEFSEEFQSAYLEESHARWTTQFEQDPNYGTASLVTTKSEWKACISPVEIFTRPEDARLASIFHRKY